MDCMHERPESLVNGYPQHCANMPFPSLLPVSHSGPFKGLCFEICKERQVSHSPCSGDLVMTSSHTTGRCTCPAFTTRPRMLPPQTPGVGPLLIHCWRYVHFSTKGWVHLPSASLCTDPHTLVCCGPSLWGGEGDSWLCRTPEMSQSSPPLPFPAVGAFEFDQSEFDFPS